MWSPGDTVVGRNVARGKIWSALAATVAVDTPGLVALYWRPGYPFKSVALTGRLLEQLGSKTLLSAT
jgi:hypothetical protein